MPPTYRDPTGDNGSTQTEAGPYHGDPPWALLGGGFQAGLPTDSADWEPDAELQFVGAVETTKGSQGWGFELDMPFYTWASVIVNGRVVATDYAPDSGWLVATPGVALTPISSQGAPTSSKNCQSDSGSMTEGLSRSVSR